LGPVARTAMMDVRVRGGAGDDRFDANFRCELDGRLRLSEVGDAGDDTSDARLLLESGSTGQLAAVVATSSGRDVSALRVRDDSVGAVSSLLANLGEPLTLGTKGWLSSYRKTAA